MCSYNRVNNSYSCQNSKLLNGLLKTELGFEGWVTSDWDGQRKFSPISRIVSLSNLYSLDTGLSSTLAGLDVAMPNSSFWGTNGENLTLSVTNGSVPESRVTDMVTRIVASWYQMGQDVCTLP